ncbi:type I methionyl aminopeptidase [Aquincola sp. MAHUQ-54]|uniref:Methionine aminopeptidase n=1 Tax=Aquincola agrisoli TaxID=3119538 RepID=A0AAW9QK20_9BURK
MTIETDADLAGLQRAGRLVSEVLHTMLGALEPGMRTDELDTIGARLLAAAGAQSAPQATYGFPAATCISINDEAAHGVPGPRRIAAGDVVNIDVSAVLDGYVADTGGTRVVPPDTPLKRRLVWTARQALDEALGAARAGAPLRGIGRTIERAARRGGFRVIRNLGSHGVGRALHEEPGFIPGFDDPHERRTLHEGLVITIEPFISTRARWADDAGDGWTLTGGQGNFSAQFEHTLVVTRGAPLVVTRH